MNNTMKETKTNFFVRTDGQNMEVFVRKDLSEADAANSLYTLFGTLLQVGISADLMQDVLCDAVQDQAGEAGPTSVAH